jgi:hypothetical protein
MNRQKLFETLQEVCNFTALESDMDEIQRAIFTDENNEIRKLLQTILEISGNERAHEMIHEMIKDAINEFLNDYEFLNK